MKKRIVLVSAIVVAVIASAIWMGSDRIPSDRKLRSIYDAKRDTLRLLVAMMEEDRILGSPRGNAGDAVLFEDGRFVEGGSYGLDGKRTAAYKQLLLSIGMDVDLVVAADGESAYFSLWRSGMTSAQTVRGICFTLKPTAMGFKVGIPTPQIENLTENSGWTYLGAIERNWYIFHTNPSRG